MQNEHRERTLKLDLQETNILAKTKSQFKMKSMKHYQMNGMTALRLAG